MSEFDIYKKYSTGVAYDIGAHVGEISIKLKENGCDVYAFEPSPNTYPILKTNCESLGIKCYNVALHEKTYDCMTPFKDCRTDYIDVDGRKMDTIQHIKYDTLYNVIEKNKLPDPSFLKIDIEGMESIVLKTLDFLFLKQRPVIYVEIHAQPKNLDNQNYKDNPHWTWPEDGGFDFNILKSYNYKIIFKSILLSTDEDWNPQPGTHSGYLLLPNEKLL
jgi:FkbM family methyltransferase